MTDYVREGRTWRRGGDPAALAWSQRVITRDAPAAECPLCRALVILDGAAMGEHEAWHQRTEK